MYCKRIRVNARTWIHTHTHTKRTLGCTPRTPRNTLGTHQEHIRNTSGTRTLGCTPRTPPGWTSAAAAADIYIYIYIHTYMCVGGVYVCMCVCVCVCMCVCQDYTHTHTHTHTWQDSSRFSVGGGRSCYQFRECGLVLIREFSLVKEFRLDMSFLQVSAATWFSFNERI